MSYTQSDPEISRLLDELPVPEHRPGFWTTLDHRLSRADTEPGAHRPRADGPVVVPGAPRRRRWARAVAVLAVTAGLIAVVVMGVQRGTDDASVFTDSPTTSTTPAPQTAPEVAAIDAVTRFLDALGHGDTKAASALLGPRSETYVTATAGSVDRFLHDAEDGYGAWANVPDRHLWAVTIRPGDVAVVIEGTHPGEGTPERRADVILARHAQSADAWFVEPWAFDPHAGGRIELVSPDPAAKTPALGTADSVQVALPAGGRTWFSFDQRPPTEVFPVRGPLGWTATWHPAGPASGRHTLLAVYEGDVTFTALARIVEVTGPPAP